MVALEAIKITDRTRLIKKGAVKNPVCNTPKVSSVIAGGIEQARYEIEKRTRSSRSRFEGVSVDLENKVLPVRLCACQITHLHVRSDGKKQIERLRERPPNNQVAEFAELNHFRDPQKAADTSKLYDRWSLVVWMGTILVSVDTTWVHQRGSAGVDPHGDVQKTCDLSRECRMK